MMSLRKFRNLSVTVDEAKKTDFLKGVGQEATKVFRDEMMGAKSGRLYRYRGRLHRASAPDEYPANMSGALRQSINYTLGGNRVTIGSNTKYAKYLAEGTKNMEPRRMSKEALQQAVPSQLYKLRQVVRFKIG